VHQQHAADALLAVLGGIDHAGAALEATRVDAAERDRADERIVHDLERKHRQRLGVGRIAHDLVALAVDAFDGRHIERGRQIVDNSIEQRLHALVLERGASEHREERAGDHSLADQLLEGRLIGLLALEIGAHGVVIEIDRRLDELFTMFLGQLRHVGGNVDVVILGSQRLLVPHHALHANEVDDALELLLGPDRKLDGDRLGAEPVHDVLEALVEVGTDLVHLVAEDDAWNFVLVALTPDRLGLRLDALIRVEHADGAVEHAQRALYLDGEVDVAGGVDDVEPMLLALGRPECRGRSRGDGDAALLLLLHEIHGRSAFVHLADLVALAGVIENPLSRRRLPGIDVGHDAEIAVVLDRMTAGHERYCPC
jgi:hypothetical protein